MVFERGVPPEESADAKRIDAFLQHEPNRGLPYAVRQVGLLQVSQVLGVLQQHHLARSDAPVGENVYFRHC